MSTLKVNKLRDTAGSADAITLDPNGGAVLAGVTTISTARITTGITTSIQVGGGVTISESGIEASGIGITCANINGTQIGGRRNIYINGAMTVAQRGTSSTEQGFKTVDRIKTLQSGPDEVGTQTQGTVASGTTPYSLGLRKSFKLTNGNQTSGAGAADVCRFQSRLEAQDIANSGWNYTDPNSKLTLSFWCKSSVAQNFYIQLVAYDGSTRSYTFETGSLTANTWTKVVHSIPGNSNLQFDNDANLGLEILWYQFQGTDRTASDHSLNSWAAYASGSQSPDMTSTWYTTDEATWELTGVQLEVGSQATAFEHLSVGEELTLCHRYYYKLGKLDYLGTHMSAGEIYGIGMSDNDDLNIYGMINFPVMMRISPTAIDQSGSASDYRVRRDTNKTCSGVPTFQDAAEHYCRVNFPSSSHGWGTGQMLWLMSAGSSGYLGFDAEL